MIAIDTNVLLRYILNDDHDQSQKAKRLIEKHGKTLITDVVLAEAVWTLGSKKYMVSKAGIIQVLTGLIEDSHIYFEDNQAIWEAMQDYRLSKPVNGKQAGFNDAFIAAKARCTAQKAGVALAGIFSFDVAALQLQGMVAIT
jgi:predicted nucleic-acid-binding protein